MDKTLQTAKLEQLKETYKDYKKAFEFNPNIDETTELSEVTKAELFWIKGFLKDLKWVLDDTQY